MRLITNWIKFDTGEKKFYNDKYGNPAPYFRKTFKLSGNPIKATLACSAVGLLKVYLNGKEISEDCLTPGWTDYRKRIPYLEVDVIQLLNQKNAIGIVVGDGWAVGKVGNDMERCNYHEEVSVGLQLEIVYGDGTYLH